MMPRIPEPAKGDKVKAEWGRDVANALNSLSLAVHSDPEAHDRLRMRQTRNLLTLILSKNPHRLFLGIVMAAGPSSEADYTDERYWIQEVAISGGATPQAQLSLVAMTHSTSAGEYRCRYVTASNLAEVADNSHLLAAGDYVGPVYQVRDDGGVAHYFFTCRPPAAWTQICPSLGLDAIVVSAAGYPDYDCPYIRSVDGEVTHTHRLLCALALDAEDLAAPFTVPQSFSLVLGKYQSGGQGVTFYGSDSGGADANVDLAIYWITEQWDPGDVTWATQPGITAMSLGVARVKFSGPYFQGSIHYCCTTPQPTARYGIAIDVSMDSYLDPGTQEAWLTYGVWGAPYIWYQMHISTL